MIYILVDCYGISHPFAFLYIHLACHVNASQKHHHYVISVRSFVSAMCPLSVDALNCGAPRALELFAEQLLQKAGDVTLSRGSRTLSPAHL